MQPKFTLRKTYGLFGRFLALAMILALSTQVSFAQKGARPEAERSAKLSAGQKAKADMLQARPSATNDAGVTTTPTIVNIPSTEAVCTTFVGQVEASDPAVSARYFRDGVPKTCAAPGVCTAPIGGAFQHDVMQWTNPAAVPQCVTVTYSTTSANFNFVVAYNGSFNPADLCQNALGDPGSSATAGVPIVWSFTAPANATIVFVVTNVVGGQTADYTIALDAAVCFAAPCTGTPTPGNTVSTANPVCPSSNFTLTPQNATPGSGVTYLWESSPDGSTWSPASGTNTNSSYTTNQTTATYYRVQVTCGANTGISTPLQVTMAPLSACYCIPTYANGCTLGDYIARVRLGTLDNATACSTPPYTYYSALPAPEVFRNANNQLIVNVGPDTFGQNVGAWIDFNQDGDFNDAGEFLGTSGNVGANGQANMTFAAPASALLGQTRMRIRGGDDTAPTGAQSCGASNSSFGEAEDYNVNIVPCVPITFTGHPTNTTAQCSGNASFTVNVNGSLPSYSWQFRVNSASPWQTVTNGGVFSNATTNTLTLTGIPSTMTGYQFRALVTGACSAVDFSNFATLTVGPLVATVTPTSATICSGQSTALNLTNVALPVTVLSEGFNSISPLPTGWFTQNNSTPAGSTSWFQGNSAVFPAQSGPATSYIGANFNNVAGANTISNWLLTPELTIKNNDVLKFWTRTVDAPAFPDRLEVRMSTAGASTNVGATNTSVGDFTNLLLTINPSLTTAGYPSTWTEFTVTVSGLGGPVQGRFAFRYFVTGGGPSGFNSDYIGIDNVTYTAGAQAGGVWTSNPAAPNTMFTDPGLTTAYVAGSLASTIYVNPTVTTVYSVVYSTPSPACTSNPTNITVNVVNPATNVVAPASTAACVGDDAVFTASANGGPFTWVWEVSTNGGATWNTISGANTGTLTVNNVTQTMNNYQYRARISAPPCAGTTTTAAATLTVNALPTVTATATPNAIMPGQTSILAVTSTPAPGTPANYQWFYNGNPVAGGTGATLVAGIDELGEYQAELTDINGCTNISNTVTLGAAQSDKLWIYPNPTDGQFTVRLFYDGPFTDIRWIHIFNEKGQLVLKKAFDLYPTQPPYMQMSFDMSNFPAGTYVVKVEERFTGKTKSGLLVIQ